MVAPLQIYGDFLKFHLKINYNFERVCQTLLFSLDVVVFVELCVELKIKDVFDVPTVHTVYFSSVFRRMVVGRSGMFFSLKHLYSQEESALKI